MTRGATAAPRSQPRRFSRITTNSPMSMLTSTLSENSTPAGAILLHGDHPVEVAPQLHGLRTMMVNLYFFGDVGERQSWTLIDGGMPGRAGSVFAAAERLFGKDNPPQAIILTHGHFDHVGAVEAFIRKWLVPVYAHPLEFPFLNGEHDYSPPDPSVGQGIFARLSPLFPKHSHQYGGALQPLPADGSVPSMPGWQWIHTPGHTPGHISLFREADRALIAGDAFTTTRQESFWAVCRQQVEVRPPPAYFTTDWSASRDSMQRLADLNPLIGATGHGRVLSGPALTPHLQRLIDQFGERGVPHHGRYVEQTWHS